MITVNKANPTPGEITSSLTGSTGDGAGLHFDGAAGNIDIASPPDLGTKFSFEFVIKADSTGSSGKIVDFGDGGRFVIEHNTTGLQVKPSNAGGWVTLQSPSPLADLGVHHLVLTVDGTTATLFDNGNQTATATISATDIDSCADAKIGSYYDSATDLFNGTIYRARFYNRTLSADDVRTAYERADVDYADQYGSQTAILESDFSSGTSGFTGAGLTVAGNIDSIGGQNDTLRSTIDSSTGNHQTIRSISGTNGKRYRATGKVYIPSANALVDKVLVNNQGDLTNVIATITATDTWTDFEAEFIREYPEIRFRAYDGSANSFAGNGSDVFYIKDIKIVPAGCVSDYQTQWANPSQSLTVQDASGAADGTASASGVTQVQPVVQGNLTSLAVSSATARTPADGDIIADQLGVGVVPTYVVDVATSGNNGIRTNNGTAQLYMGSTAGVAAVGTLNDNALNLIANGGSKVIINSGGGVGINTAPDAAAKLDVNGKIYVRNTSVKGVISNPSGDIFDIANASGGTSNPITFSTQGSERMRIDSTGAVSIPSAAGSQVALTVKGGNDLVDNIALNITNQSGGTGTNIRNNGQFFTSTLATFGGGTGQMGVTINGSNQLVSQIETVNAYTLANDSTLTFEASSAVFAIYVGDGQGALFFSEYQSATVTKLAGSTTFVAGNSGTAIRVYTAGSDATVTVANKKASGSAVLKILSLGA